jgi:type IV pilus assembly protein PilV
MRLNYRQRGASLLEVLIAIVVFSLGLIGILSAAALSIRSNQDAYTLTQVTNISKYISGAMRQNRPAVIAGQYNGTHTGIDLIGGTPSFDRQCDAATSCLPSQQATDDINQLRILLGQHLPVGSNTTVNCTAQAAFAGVTAYLGVGARVPYTGACTVSIIWPQDKAGNLATRVWVIQP